jgi:hypothetical protein
MLANNQFRIFCLPVKIKIYKTVILSAVLYGCETFLTEKEEQHEGVSEVGEHLALRGMKL